MHDRNQGPIEGLVFELEARRKIISYLRDDELAAYNDAYKSQDINQNDGWDMLLPHGCEALDWHGPTYIEFKTRLIPGTLSLIKRRLETNKEKGKGRGSLVVIYRTSLIRNGIIQEIAKEDFKVQSISDLPKLNRKKKNIPSFDEHNYIKETARRIFKNGDAVLFLGAGVSISAGCPSWSELLENLIDQIKDQSNISYQCVEKNCHYSSIIMARYIKTVFQSRHKDKREIKFRNLIHNALYAQTHESDLLEAVVQLIQSKNVKSVITYNYDNLLERELLAKNIDCTSLYRGNRADIGSLPIYHVHGLIREDKRMLLDSEIVLSEDGYHNLYNEAYNWSSIEQLHALSNKNCFFIGLSMSDPNLRRLLDTASKYSDNDLYHYAFLPEPDSSGIPYELNMKTQTQIFNNLGINIIWYQKHQDLPLLLKELL